MADIVAGNPKANRTGLCVALAIVFLVLVCLSFIALRKTQAPQKTAPLHPAGLIAIQDKPIGWVG